MPHLPIPTARLLKAGAVFVLFCFVFHFTFYLGIPQMPRITGERDKHTYVSDSRWSFCPDPVFCGGLRLLLWLLAFACGCGGRCRVAMVG